MNPNGWLRLEGVAELVLASWLYHKTGVSWYLFALLFLVPDASMIGYLAGPKIGAWCYNILHTYALAIALGVAGLVLGHPLVYAIGLIWCGHIAFDRMMGYGLKYPQAFQTTHLGNLGGKPKL